MASLNTTEERLYSNASGWYYPNHPYGAQLAGPDGPLLLQDNHLTENLAHFHRERIPERVVHAKGGGAHGYFELTDSLSDLTYALPYQKVGYKTPLTARFSTVHGELGSADTQRDPRGFSIKFHTEWGSHDWVFNNTPVFFIREPNKFEHFIHSQKRDPQTNLDQLTDASSVWDYFVQNPESIHQVTYLMGDRGTPKDWGNMSGYSGHTYKFVNDSDEVTYVQIHIIPDGGFQTNTIEEAGELNGSSPDEHQRLLFKRIEDGDYPSYTTYLQTMTPKQAEDFKYSINDLTKIWPHKEFPLRKFGKIVLDKNVTNYFEEIEQIAFSPSRTFIPGIEPSNDPVLQSRIWSYPDTQRYRLGANYEQLPINSGANFVKKPSGCPFLAGNFQRAGQGAIISQGNAPNYIPLGERYKSSNKYGQPGKAHYGVVSKNEEVKSFEAQKNQRISQHEQIIWNKQFYYQLQGLSELDLEQPRDLYHKVFSKVDREHFVKNILGASSNVSNEIIRKQIPQYWGLIDKELGAKVAKGLEVDYVYLSPEEYAGGIGVSKVLTESDIN
ncbi:hypothetical protein WICMUC_002758 [Wickerhamomyces mucosus]|uniref:Catalase T n=1 Tax=Wickerhamomyces mucosus TaxID=1378264 RepID=A0A9P8TE52_9ASCO|nr:hypothetical protein WICMUC_002758 [Wickerhamomyces mucosus]